MKKFLLSLAAIVALGFSANADYYLVGAFNEWDNGQANTKFTAGANGTYTFDYNGTISGAFKITDGSWTDANCYGSNGSAIEIGTPYNLVKPAPAGDGGNILCASAFVNPHFLLTIDGSGNGTLLVTGGSQTLNITYDIWGNFATGEWGQTVMTESNGNWVASNIVSEGGEFGIRQMASGKQQGWYSASNSSPDVVLNTPMTCATSDNANFKIGKGTFTFTFNANDKTLTVTGTSSGTTYPSVLYLIGTINGSGFNPGNYIEMAATSEGVYTATATLGEVEGFTGFSFCTSVNTNNDWNSIGPRYGAAPNSGSDVYVSSGSTYDLVRDGDPKAFTIESGTYTITADLAKMKMTITGESDVPVTYPETLYVLGDFPVEGTSWKPSYGVALNQESEGIYKGEVTFGNANANTEKDPVAYFSFCTSLGDDWSSVGTRYGANANTGDENNVAVSANGTYPIYKSGEPAAFYIEGDSTAEIKVDLATMQLSILSVTMVDNVIADQDATPVYYNLQGARVDAPAAGLYIVVRGNKVAKEIIR